MNTVLIIIALIMSIILYHYYDSISIPQRIVKNGKFTDENNEIIYKYNNKISSVVQVIGSWYFLGLTFFQIYKRATI